MRSLRMLPYALKLRIEAPFTHYAYFHGEIKQLPLRWGYLLQLKLSLYTVAFRLELIKGPGAGYIGGRSAFLAFRCWDPHFTRRCLLQLGCTDNANIIPIP